MLQEWSNMVDAWIDGQSYVPKLLPTECRGAGAECHIMSKGSSPVRISIAARVVCHSKKKITISDLFPLKPNQHGLGKSL